MVDKSRCLILVTVLALGGAAGARAQAPTLQGGVDEKASPLNVQQHSKVPAVPDNAADRLPAKTLLDLQAEMSKVKQPAALQGAVNDHDFMLPLDLTESAPKFAPLMPTPAPVQAPMPVLVRPLPPDLQHAFQLEQHRARRPMPLGNAFDWWVPREDNGVAVEMPSAPRKAVKLSPADEKAFAQEMLKGKLMPWSPNRADSAISGELKRAKQDTDKQLAIAATQLRSILRRPAQEVKLDVDAQMMPDHEAIAWDEWYARVGHLAEPLLLKCLAQRGDPSGTNTLEITVLANHKLTVRLSRGAHYIFDEATMMAYRALSGRKELQFPSGSRRDHVTFLVDNVHSMEGTVSDVVTTPCTGDRE